MFAICVPGMLCLAKVQFVPSSELISRSHSGIVTNRSTSYFLGTGTIVTWCHSRATVLGGNDPVLRKTRYHRKHADPKYVREIILFT
jgi:hypothetical protein